MCWVAAAPYIMAAISAAGAYQQSSAAKGQAKYQAKVAENNAQIASQQAADAKERGDAAAAEVRRKYAGLQGTQAASLAARGLDISEGSANAILSDTDFFGDYDQRMTRSNAAKEAWGYKMRAGNFAGDAAAYAAGADAINPGANAAMAGVSGYFSAGGKMPGGSKDSALTSSGTVSSRWFGKKDDVGSMNWWRS